MHAPAGSGGPLSGVHPPAVAAEAAHPPMSCTKNDYFLDMCYFYAGYIKHCIYIATWAGGSYIRRTWGVYLVLRLRSPETGWW